MRKRRGMTFSERVRSNAVNASRSLDWLSVSCAKVIAGKSPNTHKKNMIFFIGLNTAWDRSKQISLEKLDYTPDGRHDKKHHHAPNHDIFTFSLRLFASRRRNKFDHAPEEKNKREHE